MYHARERHFGAFENTYQLPHDADASRVNADVKRGVLTVTVPKSVEERNRSEAAEAGGGDAGVSGNGGFVCVCVCVCVDVPRVCELTAYVLFCDCPAASWLLFVG